MNQHAYLNQILFPACRVPIDAAFLESALPWMYTKSWKAAQLAPRLDPAMDVSVASAAGAAADVAVAADRNPDLSVGVAVPEHSPNLYCPTQKNSLFWAIHVHEHPELAAWTPASLSVNMEVDTRMAMVDALRTQPKRLRDTNAKLTMEQTQGLLGGMMVAQVDDLSFCTVYAVHYQKSILVCFPRTFKWFRPSLSATVEDDSEVIILHVQRKLFGRNAKSQLVYCSDLDSTKEKAEALVAGRVDADLLAVSKYSLGELETIAGKLDVGCRTEDGKRKKKNELYDEVRLAVHRDMTGSAAASR
jgi:hypothetical protein